MSRAMKVMTHGLAAAGAVAVVVMLGAGRAGELAQPEAPADMQKAMADYMKSIKPGEKHKYLEQFVGEWDTTMRMFMAPGAPPIESKGTAKFEMAHGGRYVKQETTGVFKMPGMDGKVTEIPMNGLGLTGYDNNRKLYTMVWTDTMSTGIIVGKGNLSQDGKVMTMFGDMDEPMTGEIGKPVRYVTRVVSKDKFVFEISEVLYGDAFKVVEVEYNRKTTK